MNVACIILDKLLYMLCAEEYSYYSNKICFDYLNIVCYKSSLGILITRTIYPIMHFTELEWRGIGASMSIWICRPKTDTLTLLSSSFNTSSKAGDLWSKLSNWKYLQELEKNQPWPDSYRYRQNLIQTKLDPLIILPSFLISRCVCELGSSCFIVQDQN